MSTNNMEWISVKDRLPSQEENCLYYAIKDMPGPNLTSVIVSGFFSGDQFYDIVDRWPNEIDEISHWTPLPEPPKE